MTQTLRNCDPVETFIGLAIAETVHYPATAAVVSTRAIRALGIHYAVTVSIGAISASHVLQRDR